jgi:hypothetical protein
MMTLASIPTKSSCRRASTLRPRAVSQLAGIATRTPLLDPATRILASGQENPWRPEEKRCGFRELEFPAPTV